MVFSTPLFLFFFLPIFLILYFLLPYKNITLLIFSLIFYAWGEPIYVLLMIFSSIVDFNIGKKIEKVNNKKFYLILSIFINLLILTFFKYCDFLIEIINYILSLNIDYLNLPLPIGISFFTFQTMSYSIDVYKKQIKAEKKFLNFMTYVCMFPQLIAGPIVRYKDISKELITKKISINNFYKGFIIFLEGLFLKVLLANNIGFIFNEIIKININDISILTMWLAIISFTFQIYFDFSGYSKMAIGIGKMIGFTYIDNFNYPFLSTSISEFFRNWHISLGNFFKDYVYIPLGGNKKHLFRNLFVVWFLTGLWHGASINFVIWGLYLGFIIYLEKTILKNILTKIPNIIKKITTFILIVISFYIFAFDNINDLINYGKILFGFTSNKIIDNLFLFYIKDNFILISLCILFCFKVKKIFDERVEDRLKEFIYFILYIITISYLLSSSFNPFLYFRF